MIAAIISILPILKPLLAPLVAFLAGWLFPSPLQKAINAQGAVHDAEIKASTSSGDVSDLDRLP